MLHLQSLNMLHIQQLMPVHRYIRVCLQTHTHVHVRAPNLDNWLTDRGVTEDRGQEGSGGSGATLEELAL